MFCINNWHHLTTGTFHLYNTSGMLNKLYIHSNNVIPYNGRYSRFISRPPTKNLHLNKKHFRKFLSYGFLFPKLAIFAINEKKKFRLILLE